MKGKINNIVFTKKAFSLVTAFVLAGTLTGCGSNVNVKDDTVSSSSIEQVSSSDSVSKSVEVSSADSAVEKSIEIMIDGAERLAESTEKTKNSEVYNEAKEEAIDNFIVLSEFLRGEREIAGYTVDEVKEETVQFAEESLGELDSDLERIYPDYKEILREKGVTFVGWLEDKGTDVVAMGYDKYQELKQKTLEKISK